MKPARIVLESLFRSGALVFTTGLLIGILVLISRPSDRTTGPTLDQLARGDVGPVDGALHQPDETSELPYVLARDRVVTHEQIDYRTNSHGFRDRDIELAKPEGVARVAVLGDSYTFGHGVALEDTIPRRLEDAIAQLQGSLPVEVLNLGISGYNTELQVDLLRSRGLVFEPDLVLVLYYVNDPDRLLDSPLGRNGNEVTLAIQRFLANQPTGPPPEAIETYLIDQLGHDGLARLRARPTPADYHELLHLLPEFWNSVEASFAELEELALRENFDVMVAVLPGFDHPWDRYPYDWIHHQVIGLASSHGFETHDLRPALAHRPTHEHRLSERDGHTNPEANRSLAAWLAPRVTEPLSKRITTAR